MMLLIQWLIFGHIHHWKTLDFGTVVNGGKGLPIGRWYDEECTGCGKRRYRQDA